MPEIKHNFAGGKMNKDLDERLVPNGEYRDAMNIQVSTSEGSDVGTVQNILGNSLVPGQQYISENMTCVGSVADEKNDKLYFFVTGKELLSNGTFEGRGDWVNSDGQGNYDDGKPWSIKNGRLETGVGVGNVGRSDHYGYITHPVPEIVNGKTYRFTYDLIIGSPSGGTFNLSNHDASGGNVDMPEKKIPGTYSVVWEQGSSHENEISIYGNANFDAAIDNISITESSSYILQYDSKTNSILPVIVDLPGDALKFHHSRHITGINIIDGMLFWTDGNSEPKKINIARCIEGTSSLGTQHTSFINNSRDLLQPLQEKHITVIKESPKSAPLLNLISERDPLLSYSGIINITNGAGQANTSSLRKYGEWDNSGYSSGNYFDFRDIVIGSKFYAIIGTDINGENGFELDYKRGDVILFKEFDYDLDTGIETPPNIPITDYRLKTRIVGSDPATGGSAVFYLNDAESEYVTTPNLDISNSTGDRPKDITWSSGYGTYFLYDSFNNKIDINIPDANAAWQRFRTDRIITLDSELAPNGGTYRMTVEISNYTSGELRFDIQDNDANLGSGGNKRRWNKSGISGDGTHTWDITLDETTGIAHNGYTEGTWNIGVDNTTGFVGSVNSISFQHLDASNAAICVEVLDINGFPPRVPVGKTTLQYAVDRLDTEKNLFQLKFPRFAYRYKYQDNEYSSISPFSSIAFIPGSFDYHPKKGYNLGMTNNLHKIEINNFTDNIPDGVDSIDILYKDDTSTNVYVVDSIKPQDEPLTYYNGTNNWDANSYLIEAESVKQTLPSNQLLRVWDNVPRKALAQDITGNRIVYGNYVQNYDLKSLKLTNDALNDFQPDFNFSITGNVHGSTVTKSVKSLRDYQIGVVYVDDYGRETPVLTNSGGVSSLDKIDADRTNKLQVALRNYREPINMKYFKFYIKETSGEYYNMAMDRYYEGGDGLIWLSFPSTDRNKIDIDSFLILKKGLESDKLVKEEARYKILAIENEAPDFIKTEKVLITNQTHDLSQTSISKDVFGSSTADAPIRGVDSFKMKYQPFYGSTGSHLHESVTRKGGDLYIEFGSLLEKFVSDRYRITSITTDYGMSGVATADAFYSVQLDRPLETDVDAIVDNINNPSFIKNTTTVKVYRHTVENSPRFDGRFFVKIINDDVFNREVELANPEEKEYRTIRAKKVYSMNADFIEKHNSNNTGQEIGKYGASTQSTNIATTGNASHYSSADDIASERSLFGRFACYFRNYKMPQGSVYAYLNDGTDDEPVPGDPTIDVSAYAFGDATGVVTNGTQTIDGSTDQPWLFELAYLTSFTGSITNQWDASMGDAIKSWWLDSNDDIQYVYYNGPTSEGNIKKADDHGWTIEEWGGKFNNAGEQEAGSVWFIDAGPFAGQRYSNLSHHYDWFSYWGTDEGNIKYGTGINATTGKIKISMNATTDLYATENNVTVDALWDIGVDSDTIQGTNSRFNTPATTDFVANITPGTRFRWAEDPSGQIFTFQPGAYVNKADIRHDGEHTPWWDETGIASSYSPADYHTANQLDATAQLAPNHTRGWYMSFKNEDGGTTMDWDPTNNNSTGPIPGGIHLSVNHSGITTGAGNTANSEFILLVDSLETTDVNTGEFHSISTGMILTSYNTSTPVPLTCGTYTANTSTSAPYGGNSFDPLIIKKIEYNGSQYQLWLCGYERLLTKTSALEISGGSIGKRKRHILFDTAVVAGENLTFRQPAMNGYSQYSVNRINAYDRENDGWSAENPGLLAVGYNFEFVNQLYKDPVMPDNPAIWETEPKESTDLDIYYQASDLIPFTINDLPLVGAKVTHSDVGALPVTAEVLSFGKIDPGTGSDSTPADEFGFYLTIGDRLDSENQTSYYDPPWVGGTYINAGDSLTLALKNGTTIKVRVRGWYLPMDPTGTGQLTSQYIFVESRTHYPSTSHVLSWHNCYSFGNGVESNRVADSFNLPFILNGVTASTTLEEQYQEDHRKYGLIYSGIYNSNSGVNNLNQFIMAEKITKDINPIYGSIQKLHTRDTDLITLCEDKVLRILANKDAVFNADGNPNLTATENVLGQTVPFVGEYGISTDPESFASESYRAYFTDRVRGTVMRLSKDGLTPISEHGMKDWFRDNLSIGVSNLLGDNALDKQSNWDIPSNKNTRVYNRQAILGYYSDITRVDDSRYGKSSYLQKEDILEIGKKYRLQFDVVGVSGPTHEGTGEINNLFIRTQAGSGGKDVSIPIYQGKHVNVIFAAGQTKLEIQSYHTNQTAGFYDGIPGSQTTTIQEYVGGLRGEDGSSDAPWTYGAYNYIYLQTTTIENIILEEVKETPKIIGSYDDKKDEYNVTINSTNPSTVSFKEDVKGWVSFKSFIPESALSCANDYYTVKNGKLYQHHSQGVDTNTFYNSFTESSVGVLLNDSPSSVKSFHTINYEGSQSKIDYILGEDLMPIGSGTFDNSGLWTLNSSMGTAWHENNVILTAGTHPDYGIITLSMPGLVNGKVYRITYDLVTPNTSGRMLLANMTTYASTLNSGTTTDNVYLILDVATPAGTYSIEWEHNGDENNQTLKIYNDPSFDGAIDNVKVQEVMYLNQYPSNLVLKDGWYANNIKTDQQEGHIHEFVEKEGKWFNYIKGVDSIIDDQTDLSSLNIQGIGRLTQDEGGGVLHFDNINTSLQIGDTIYYVSNNNINNYGEPFVGNDIIKLGKVADLVGNIITMDSDVSNQVYIDDYFMFVKNQIINTSGLLGYYADVTFKNNSKRKAELFAISSEVTESSN